LANALNQLNVESTFARGFESYLRSHSFSAIDRFKEATTERTPPFADMERCSGSATHQPQKLARTAKGCVTPIISLADEVAEMRPRPRGRAAPLRER
jgi:hypothetical protein